MKEIPNAIYRKILEYSDLFKRYVRFQNEQADIF